MKVVTAETMRLAEQIAMAEFPITGQVLMETAGRGCCDVLLREFKVKSGCRVAIFAGKGNNGGDGFVIARCLLALGLQVRVFLLASCEDVSGDARRNLDLLDPSIVFSCGMNDDLLSHQAWLNSAALIVDALFGTGLDKVLSGVHATAVALINNSDCPVLAVDTPSGIDATTGRMLGCAVRSDVTVTFDCAKLGHVLYPGRFHTGKLFIVDIGLPAEVQRAMKSFEFIDAPAAALQIKARNRCGHKGDYGHCLIVAGSVGKTGAAALAANSAVRTGSGLVTLAVPASLNAILEVKTTEAMTYPLQDRNSGCLLNESVDEILQLAHGKAALALGPGIGRSPGTASLVNQLVRSCPVPMVIDADGLNALAEDVSVFKETCSTTIVLTPHPGEMARLSGLSVAEVEYDRIAAAENFASRHGVYVVLKGASTIIAAPDGTVAINGSGNPGMASGGMGDVLTGIIVSLLGQGYAPMDACCLGVFVHGFAGDLVAKEIGETGMCATDVQENIPRAYKSLLEGCLV